MNDAPDCWGKFNADCVCEYSEACRLFTETEPSMNRPMYGQDYDEVGEWAPDLADYDHTPGSEPEEPEAATTAPERQGAAAEYARQCPSGERAANGDRQRYTGVAYRSNRRPRRLFCPE